MDTNKMKPISDLLFEYLTLQVFKEGNDFDSFVNSEDGKIYLVETRDGNYYFLTSGRFKITDTGNIYTIGRDNCIFALNAKTFGMRSLSRIEIKRVIDWTSPDIYLLKLKEWYFNLIDETSEYMKHQIEANENKELENGRDLYKKHYEIAKRLRKLIKKRDEEDLFEFAERASSNKFLSMREYLYIMKELEEYIKYALYESYASTAQSFERGLKRIDNLMINVNPKLNQLLEEFR